MYYFVDMKLGKDNLRTKKMNILLLANNCFRKQK